MAYRVLLSCDDFLERAFSGFDFDRQHPQRQRGQVFHGLGVGHLAPFDGRDVPRDGLIQQGLIGKDNSQANGHLVSYLTSARPHQHRVLAF